VGPLSAGLARDSTLTVAVDFETFQRVLNRPGGFRDPGEPEEYCRGFQVFDKDMTGFIGVGQLKYILTNLGEKMSDEEVEELLKVVDTSSGQVNYTGTPTSPGTDECPESENMLIEDAAYRSGPDHSRKLDGTATATGDGGGRQNNDGASCRRADGDARGIACAAWAGGLRIGVTLFRRHTGIWQSIGRA